MVFGGKAKNWWDDKTSTFKQFVMGAGIGWFLLWPALGWIAQTVGNWSLTSFSLTVSAEPWKMAVGLGIGLVLTVYLWDKGMFIFAMILSIMTRLGVTAWGQAHGWHVGEWYLMVRPVIEHGTTLMVHGIQNIAGVMT
jgi:hypothetical protein